MSTCQWYQWPDECIWESECGVAWEFTGGGPEENDMKFCCKCGQALEVAQQDQHDDQ